MALPKPHTVNEPAQLFIAEPPHPDYLKLLTCLKIFGAALCIAAVLYGLTRDKNIAVSIMGASFVILTLFHTPFGLLGLFAFLSLENAFVLREDFSYSKLLGILIFVSYLLRLVRIKFIFTAPQKLMILFCLWCWVTMLWSVSPDTSITMLQTFTLYMGICLIALNTLEDKQSLYCVLVGFVIGAAICSYMLMFGNVEQSSYAARELGRVSLTEDGGGPVIMGRVIGFGSIITFLAFLAQSKILKKIAIALLVLFFLALVTKAQARMGLICAFVVPVLAFVLVCGGKNRLKNMFIAGSVLIALYVALNITLSSGLMPGKGSERFKGQGLEASGRLNMWSEGLAIVMKKPVHGAGFSAAHLARASREKGSLHSNYISILADLGLIGAILIGWLLLILYRQNKQITDTRLKFLCMAMWLYACISGLTSVNYTKKDFWYAIMLCMIGFALHQLGVSKKRTLNKAQKSSP
jgi:hypothetical protein